MWQIKQFSYIILLEPETWLRFFLKIVENVFI